MLIDTSCWVHALREKGDQKARDRLSALIVSGQAAWCEMIRLELWNGSRGADEKRRLRDFDRDLPRLPIDQNVWDLACALARSARQAGLTVPANDLVIFACAKHHQSSLEHDDEHFDRLEKLSFSGNGRE